MKIGLVAQQTPNGQGRGTLDVFRRLTANRQPILFGQLWAGDHEPLRKDGAAVAHPLQPAACHVLVAPLARDVGPVSDHEVNVVAYDGHRADVDRKLPGQKR